MKSHKKYIVAYKKNHSTEPWKFSNMLPFTNALSLVKTFRKFSSYPQKTSLRQLNYL